MRETAADLVTLQRLLDLSFATASQHLRSIMTPPRRLDAAGLVAALPATAILHLATVTARGEPRVSAVDGLFLHGRWYFTTDAGSPKARQLRARPATSAAFTAGQTLGVFCHGRAVFLDGDERAWLRARVVEVEGSDPEDWRSGDGGAPATIAYVRIDAHWLVAFAAGESQSAIDS